jgi:adenylylsulfate kinase
MASTYQRSLVKGIIWEGFSFIITLIAVYLIYGDISTSLKFTFGLTVIKMGIFFIHERIWKKIKWGKIE